MKKFKKFSNPAPSTRATNGALAGQKRVQGTPGGQITGFPLPRTEGKGASRPTSLYQQHSAMQVRALLGNVSASLVRPVITSAD